MSLPAPAAKAYCEACETTFTPKTIDEDDILCPPCNASAGSTRGIYAWIEKDNRRRKTGLLPRKVPHRAGPEDWQRMNLEQGGRCAICGHQPTNGSLVIDHNHRTGEVRGLLCAGCNSGLGQLGDHPDILRKAIEYLNEHGHYGAYPRPPDAVRAR